MHEMSITQEIVNVVDDARRGAGDDARVLRVSVKIGKFTAVVPDCIQFYFDMLTEDTPMRGAALDFEVVQTRVRCSACSAEFDIEDVNLFCVECGSGDTEIIAGRELFVESIEVAAEGPAETE
jgi:hydrogenase nickel incorporation protein HypA/HybF